DYSCQSTDGNFNWVF
nr:immunoglobulin light chain junction region [Macaca mulatta]MOX36375.1 immunoglobulin light chain junction region [Macaca mulatta]MOX37418.1 immunoglobulin light chain junction region [Macaca mulatta]